MSDRTPRRVLVVEDDPSALELLGKALGEAGWVVEAAPDGPSAVEACERKAFSLALVDISSAGAGGSKLIEEIARQAPDLPVLVIGESAEVAAAVACLRVGAYDYLAKPLSKDLVLARLDRALERLQLLQERRRHAVELESRVRLETQAVRRLFLGAIESLSSALEAKDDYTRGHSERVSRLAEEIARTIGASPDDARRMALAGRLHDIGKIGVRESVLAKPGDLTDEEYRHVQSHPVVGERILAPILMDVETVSMVRNHHEHYGGGGYPDNLRGSAIPLGARVLAVADTYDALTSDRPYRPRMDSGRALEALRAGAGAQWQPVLVEALAQAVERMQASSGARADR